MTRTGHGDAFITNAEESAPLEIIVVVLEDELHEKFRKAIIERALSAALTPSERLPRSADERPRATSPTRHSSGFAGMKRARDGKSPVHGRLWRQLRDDTLSVETRTDSAVADHATPFEAVVRRDPDAAAKAARESLDADRGSMGR